MKNLNKQALTEIELSPEEKYLASKNLGRSLYSMIQLAREKELLEKRKDMSESGDVEDAPALKIPIPIDLLPQKAAAFSIVERPDGSIDKQVLKTPNIPSDTPSPESLALGAGYLTAGLPGALISGSAASLLPPEKEYNDYPQHVKTLKHPDGSIEHIYDVPKDISPKSFVKRNTGALLGGAGALALLGGSGKNKLLKALLAAPTALTGAVVGSNVLDTATENNAKKEILNNPKFQEKALKDMLFLRSKNLEKNSSAESDNYVANALENLARSPGRIFLGAREGFKSARKEYYLKQKALIAQQLEEAQKEYIDTLKRIKTAEENSATPLVDCFCNGMAHMTFFGKTASYPEVSIEDDAFKRLLSDVIKLNNPIKPVVQTAANTAVNTAAASAYLTYLVKKKMREEPENYMNDKLPTRVEIQPI
jgi:hypothetical protein